MFLQLHVGTHHQQTELGAQLRSCIGLGLLENLLHDIVLLVQFLLRGVVPPLTDLVLVVHVLLEQIEVGEHLLVVLLLSHGNDVIAVPAGIVFDLPVGVGFPELIDAWVIPHRLLLREHAEHVIVVGATEVATTPCLGAHEEHQHTNGQESLHSLYV